MKNTEFQPQLEMSYNLGNLIWNILGHAELNCMFQPILRQNFVPIFE